MGDDNVDAPQEPPPEAVEAEELQFGKNKKKKRAQESDSQMQVRCVPGCSCRQHSELCWQLDARLAVGRRVYTLSVIIPAHLS